MLEKKIVRVKWNEWEKGGKITLQTLLQLKWKESDKCFVNKKPAK